MRNKKLLEDFIAYCEAHPDERFWQALRNWAGVNFIIKADALYDFGAIEGTEDTFYWEKKNGQ